MTDTWKEIDIKGPIEDRYSRFRDEDGKLPRGGIDVTPKDNREPVRTEDLTADYFDERGNRIVIKDGVVKITPPEADLQPCTENQLKAMARLAREIYPIPNKNAQDKAVLRAIGLRFEDGIED